MHNNKLPAAAPASPPVNSPQAAAPHSSPVEHAPSGKPPAAEPDTGHGPSGKPRPGGGSRLKSIALAGGIGAGSDYKAAEAYLKDQIAQGEVPKLPQAEIDNYAKIAAGARLEHGVIIHDPASFQAYMQWGKKNNLSLEQLERLNPTNENALEMQIWRDRDNSQQMAQNTNGNSPGVQMAPAGTGTVYRGMSETTIKGIKIAGLQKMDLSAGHEVDSDAMKLTPPPFSHALEGIPSREREGRT